MGEEQLEEQIKELERELDIRYPTSLEFDEEGNLRLYYGDGMWGEMVKKKGELCH